MSNLKPSKYIDLQPFQAWVQQSLPAVYDDSLSYTDLLAKMLAYLNNLVANNNTLSTDVTNAINYINTFFESTDFQDKVDDKLNRMASDGSLSRLIQPLFDEYKIEINAIVTEQNNKINYLSTYITPEMFGAVGDGVADDTEALKRAISYSNENNKLLLGTGKSYLIKEDITLSCNFNLNNSKIISDGLKITLKSSCELTNGVLYNTHILISEPLVKLDEITFKNFTLSAITINEGAYEPFISNIRIETNVSSVDTVAITCNTDDATFSKVYGYGAHKGIINNGADNYYEDIHLWLNYFNVFDGSVFITNSGGAVFFTNCCCDSYKTFYTETLKYLTTRIDNCHWLNNNSIFNGKTFTLFDIPESHDASYLQGSLIVDIPSVSSNNKVNIGNQFTNVKLTNYNGNFSDFKTYLNRDLLQGYTNVPVSLLDSSMATSNCLTYFGYVTNGNNRIIVDLKKFLYIAKIKKKQLLTDIVIQKENESAKDGKALVTIENGLITIEPYLSSADAKNIWSVWMTIYY